MTITLKRDSLFGSTWTVGKYLIQKERLCGLIKKNGCFIVYFKGQEIARLKKLRDAKEFISRANSDFNSEADGIL